MTLTCVSVETIKVGNDTDVGDIDNDANEDEDVESNLADNARGALKCFATDHDTHLNQSHPFASWSSTKSTLLRDHTSGIRFCDKAFHWAVACRSIFNIAMVLYTETNEIFSPSFMAR